MIAVLPGNAALAAVPLEPSREQARAWAVQELSRREYQEARPGLVARALTWLWDRFNLLDLGAGAPPTLALVAIALIVAGVIWYAVRRSGGLHRNARRASVRVLPDRPTTAVDHRVAADRHAAAGEWDLALVERFRAVAREFEEQALLDPQPGRTALEVARAGGRARPDLAPELLRAAGSFDDVSYGHLTIGPAPDETLRELDRRLRAGTAATLR